MTVIADITMSLDGYVTGPGDDIGHLHDWVFGGSATGTDPRSSTSGIDAQILTDSFETRGAVVMGRRTYDITNGWNGKPPFHVPCFVLTSQPREAYVTDNGTSFEFVLDGAAAAIDRARAAAGDTDVSVMGGAQTITRALDAGLVDELQIHLAPRLLGRGIHLFDSPSREIELERYRIEQSPWATHLFYRVRG